MTRSRHLAAEAAVNALLLSGINLETHWRKKHGKEKK
jgi:hypothetical protein